MNSPGDADEDIGKAAVEACRFHSTTLIGEDTDLLILLLYYVKPNRKDLYFRYDKSSDKVHHQCTTLIVLPLH